MSLLKISPLRRHERATLAYSYAGELGRGSFKALCTEFALTVAIYQFLIEDKWALALLSSAAFIGLIVAVFATSLTVRHRKKSILFGLEAVSRVVVLLAALVSSGTAFVLLMAAGIALSAVGTPLISGIYGANFNTIIRGRAVGRLQGVAVGATAVVAFLAGLALKQGTEYYVLIFAVVSTLSLACSWYGSKLPEPRRAPAEARRLRLGDFVRVLATDRAFLYIEVVWFIFGFCNLWLLPMRVIRLREIGFSPQEIVLATTTVFFTTQVLTVGLWGRLLYRLNFGLYRILIGFFFIVGMLVFFHAETLPTVCIGTFIWGLGLSGGALSWRLVATFFTTPGQGPLYMCIHATLCGIRGLIGPGLALYLHESHSVHFVVWLTIGGLLLSNLMLVPLIPVMKRRQQAVDRQRRPNGASAAG